MCPVCIYYPNANKTKTILFSKLKLVLRVASKIGHLSLNLAIYFYVKSLT